jgi:hypothetical protein
MPFSDKTEKQKDALVDDILLVQNNFKKMGYFAYPAFGTLLGIVREQDFISHDVDIDMCWHSEFTNKPEVSRDVLKMYHRTRKNGLMGYVHNYLGTMKVNVTPEMREGGLTYMDMCVSWTEKGDYWVNIFGNYGILYVTPREATLRGKTILIPKDAEKFLEHTYGDWKIPRDRAKDTIRAKHIEWGSYLLKD